MTEYDSTVVFNGVTLYVRSLSPVKKQKTIKQFIGKSLTETKILGVAEYQWTLSITGVILGTSTATLSVNRAAVEGLDTNTAYAFTDGIHDGTYILVPGSLSINDSGDNAGMSYPYSVILVQQ